jgi:tRNA(Ile)-lysidine synthase
VALPRERQVNVLRWWIAEQGLGTPSTARLASILRDLVPARDDAQPVVTWPEGEVRRYRGRLYAMQPLGQATQRAYAIEPGQRLFIEGTGSVVLEESTGEGIDAARFPGPYELRLRRGGEKLRPAGRAEERSVGRLLVEGGVEPWLRARVPLVYHGSRLLAVADRWLAAEAVVAGDGRGLQLRWIAAGCGTPARRP